MRFKSAIGARVEFGDGWVASEITKEAPVKMNVMGEESMVQMGTMIIVPLGTFVVTQAFSSTVKRLRRMSEERSAERSAGIVSTLKSGLCTKETGL